MDLYHVLMLLFGFASCIATIGGFAVKFYSAGKKEIRKQFEDQAERGEERVHRMQDHMEKTIAPLSAEVNKNRDQLIDIHARVSVLESDRLATPTPRSGIHAVDPDSIIIP